DRLQPWGDSFSIQFRRVKLQNSWWFSPLLQPRLAAVNDQRTSWFPCKVGGEKISVFCPFSGEK
ncbi:MAG: hypothetical protein ACKOUM_00180, partial [Sphingopyxis sp.]